MKYLLPLLFVFLVSTQLTASHLIGGNVSYEHLGNYNYRFTVTQYRDCRPPGEGGGNPQALSSDNPLFASIFSGNGNFFSFDSIYSTSINGQVVQSTFPNIPCLSNAPSQCVNKIVFVYTKNLPPNATGYYFITQRCCWAETMQNITDPGSFGQNLITFIAPNQTNNSAVFKKDVGDFLCMNRSQTIDFSATDADGDSLSYKMAHLSKGADQNNPKQVLTVLPPNQPILYSNNYTFQDPMGIGFGADFNLNSSTGIMTVKPNLQGLFLMGVICTEWRNGIAIQENERNVVVRVIACSGGLKVSASPDAATQFNVPIQVSAIGAAKYKWSIAPSSQNMIYFQNDSIANTTVLFNTSSLAQTGIFTLSVEGSSNVDTCTGRDSLQLTVLDEARFFVPNAFTPNYDNLNDRLKVYCVGYDFELMRVFNKYGNKVFESNSLSNNWDGTHKGQAVGPETFIWAAQVRDGNGKLKGFSGTVTVIR